MGSATNSVYSGTSGIVVPVAKAFYPKKFRDKSRLTYYASLFNSLEINSSFYKLPMQVTVSKWVESVPANFRFSFKLSKVITHTKELIFDPADVARFMQIISPAVNKNACLLIQFPRSLKANSAGQLKKLLYAIKKADPQTIWKIAIEFRDPSWYCGNIYTLLKKFKAAIVIHDMPGSAPPETVPSTSFTYLRFHGPGGRYRGTYPAEILYQYAQFIKKQNTAGKKVYIYFNNTMGEAFNNLQTLNNLLQV